MKAFFDMMDKDPRKVMILGGSCTSVTDSIAKTSKHWRIPVVIIIDYSTLLIEMGQRATDKRTKIVETRDIVLKMRCIDLYLNDLDDQLVSLEGRPIDAQ